MDKETADAWAEQQAREIKNLKAMKRSEKNRVIKMIEKLNIWQPECSYICVDKKELKKQLNSPTKPEAN